MIKKLIYLLIFSVIIFGGLFFLKFIQIQNAMKQFQPPPPPVVAYTEVKEEIWKPVLKTVGSLVAVKGVNVTNEIAGIVQKIHFESGQNVKKGKLLIELDTASDSAELSGLIADKNLAAIELERSKKLVRDNFVSKADLDLKQAQFDKAVAVVKAKQIYIQKKHIRAPFSGKLGIRNVNIGQYLEPGFAITSLNQENPIYVDFQLPEREYNQVREKQKVLISVEAYPEMDFEGTIMAVSPSIDDNSRSAHIRAILGNDKSYLHPGMFSQVRIESEQPNQVLTLPDTSISYNTYGTFVYVIEQENSGLVAKSYQVEIGETRNGRVAIVKGLALGQRAISAGQVKIKSGMPVVLDNKSAPGERAEEIKQ